MKTLNLIALQGKYKFMPDAEPVAVGDQDKQLLELIKLYRRQEEAYFAKIKRKEFAKDELHHMKKTQQKLDLLLSTF